MGNQRGWHRGKSKLETGGLNVKFNTYRGHYFLRLFLHMQKRSYGMKGQLKQWIGRSDVNERH